MGKVLLTCGGGPAQVIVKDKTEHLQKCWLAGKFYEQSMLEYIRKHYRGGTFIDVGACIGNHTVFFANHCDAQVLSIEPVQKSFEHLLDNVRLNELGKRVTALNIALSDMPKRGKMIPFAPDGHNNVGMQRLERGIGTNVTTLDSVIEAHNIKNVRLVKIDVEYHELSVLRGMAKLLKTQRPALFVEIADEMYKEVSEFLEQFGYRVKTQHNASPTYEFIPVRKSEGLNILSVSDWDFAGCGYFLSEAINAHTPHKSRSVRDNAMDLQFPYDLQSPSKKKLAQLSDWADAIHIHSAYARLSLLPTKKTLITHHGTAYRNNYKKRNVRAQKNRWTQTVATIDLLRYGKMSWLPNTRPNLLHHNIDRDGFVICHAPTNRDKKDTDIILSACERAGVEHCIVENLTWADCLSQKARASVLIDQLAHGYGCNSIEAWAMGQLVITGGDNRTIAHIKTLALGALPFARSTEKVHILAGILERLRGDKSLRETIIAQGQAYFERWHTMPAVAQLASRLYEELAGRGKNRLKGEQYDSRYITVTYLGKNWGSEVFKPEPGLKYTFSLMPQLKCQKALSQHREYFESAKNKRTGKCLFRVE